MSDPGAIIWAVIAETGSSIASRRPRGRGAGLLLIVVGLSASACIGGSGDGDLDQADAIREARRRIEAASLSDQASLNTVDAVRFTDAGRTAAAELLERGVSGDAKWAATWVFASDPSGPGLLRPLLKDANASIRAMAAAGLISIGDPFGFDPLVAALTDDDFLTGSEPPRPIWQFAILTLERYTGALDVARLPDAPTVEELEEAQARWALWLDANRSSLVFDDATGTWSTG